MCIFVRLRSVICYLLLFTIRMGQRNCNDFRYSVIFALYVKLYIASRCFRAFLYKACSLNMFLPCTMPNPNVIKSQIYFGINSSQIFCNFVWFGFRVWNIIQNRWNIATIVRGWTFSPPLPLFNSVPQFFKTFIISIDMLHLFRCDYFFKLIFSGFAFFVRHILRRSSEQVFMLNYRVIQLVITNYIDFLVIILLFFYKPVSFGSFNN